MIKYFFVIIIIFCNQVKANEYDQWKELNSQFIYLSIVNDDEYIEKNIAKDYLLLDSQ